MRTSLKGSVKAYYNNLAITNSPQQHTEEELKEARRLFNYHADVLRNSYLDEDVVEEMESQGFI